MTPAKFTSALRRLLGLTITTPIRTPIRSDRFNARLHVTALEDRTVPSIAIGAVGAIQNAEGDGVSLQIQAADSDPDAALSYTVSGLPAGLSIDPATGLISGTIAAGDATGGMDGHYALMVTASDGTSTGMGGFS